MSAYMSVLVFYFNVLSYKVQNISIDFKLNSRQLEIINFVMFYKRTEKNKYQTDQKMSDFQKYI